jgi:hypothetical protein
MSQALQLPILTMAGWMNRQREDAIVYLREEEIGILMESPLPSP